MDNIKKFAGDAGTFLTRAVQVIINGILSMLDCSYVMKKGNYFCKHMIRTVTLKILGIKILIRKYSFNKTTIVR